MALTVRGYEYCKYVFLEFIDLFIHLYLLVENIMYILICSLYCSKNYFHTLCCAYSKFIDLDQPTVLTLYLLILPMLGTTSEGINFKHHLRGYKLYTLQHFMSNVLCIKIYKVEN